MRLHCTAFPATKPPSTKETSSVRRSDKQPGHSESGKHRTAGSPRQEQEKTGYGEGKEKRSDMQGHLQDARRLKATEKVVLKNPDNKMERRKEKLRTRRGVLADASARIHRHFTFAPQEAAGYCPKPWTPPAPHLALR